MDWNRLLSRRRLGSERGHQNSIRSPFERDYDRIIFSPAFRRLHDKTQVFPMPENDQIHSRLTHTIETASVGYSLGKGCGAELIRRYQLEAESADFGDIVASASLAHDIGNPPFGHSGEAAISSWFRDSANATVLKELLPDEVSDLQAFEGNAQGFRVLTCLQIYPEQGGMRLSFATLGAGMKYPVSSATAVNSGSQTERPIHQRKFGFFKAERDIFKEIAQELGLTPGGDYAWCRHPLAFLVEAADDICYRVLDAEDGFALRYIAMDELADHLLPIIRATDPAYSLQGNDDNERAGHMRARAIHSLVQQVQQSFIAHEAHILAGTFTRPLTETIPCAVALERLRELNASRCYMAAPVVEAELAGYEVLAYLLSSFVYAAIAVNRSARQQKLLSYLSPKLNADCATYLKILRVTDFITAMTDSFALRLYQRLTGIAR